MSRFVSADQERGYVNYEDLVKFIAKCLGDNLKSQQQMQAPPPPPQAQYAQPYGQNYGAMNSPRADQSDKFDPDEQAILRLMHENTRDWDQINLIDIDNLRRKFYEVDPYNRYVLLQREVIYFKIRILKSLV